MYIDWGLGALWAAVGMIVGKLIDMMVSRRKEKVDSVVATYDAVNEAQKQLVEGLFQQVRLLQEELANMRLELKRCQEQHQSANRRVDELEQEVATLKARLDS